MFTLFLYSAVEHIELNSSRTLLCLVLVVWQDIAFIKYMSKAGK